MNANTQPKTTIDAPSAELQGAVLLFGSSHNPYATSGPDYEATKIAEKYLKKFDTAMKEMGYAALVGIEIEAEECLEEPDFDKNYMKKLHEKDNQFGSILSRSYYDGDNIIELCTTPTTPLKAADGSSTIKQVLLESTNAMPMSGEEKLAASCKLSGNAPAKYRRLIEKDIYDSTSKLGGHINISLHPWTPNSTEASCLSEETPITSSSVIGKLIFSAIQKHQLSDALTLYDGSKVVRRKNYLQEMNENDAEVYDNRHELTWKKEKESPQKGRKKDEKLYIENRLPSAACNHHLATLSNLSALYTVLAHAEDKKFINRKVMDSGELDQHYKSMYDGAPEQSAIQDNTEGYITAFKTNSPTLLAMRTLAKNAETTEEKEEIFADAERYSDCVIARAHMIDRALETGKGVISA